MVIILNHRYNIEMNKNRFFKLSKAVFSLLLISGILFSCKTTDVESKKFFTHKSKHNELQIVLLGDVMAHTGNFIMKDYDIIWDGIRDLTSTSDFTFANIEAPVSNDIPFMNYPNFNMQYSYPQAAINAGVNVMTVANNHTNDQFEAGIKSTYKWTKEIEAKYKDTQRPVYFSGLKENVTSLKDAAKSPCSYAYFEKNGIKILFFGATQILNTPSCNQMINFFPGTEEGRQNLITTVKNLKSKHPCDVFILGLHCEEPEYVLEISKTQKKLYKELLDSGVDILWANHPHTPKPIEWITDPKDGKLKKIIFYANGNTISSQRYRPNFNNPASMREYTGDGFLVQLQLIKTQNGIVIENAKLNFITNIVDENNNILIKKLNKDLYDQLDSSGNSQLKNYLKKREELLKQIEGTLPWL